MAVPAGIVAVEAVWGCSRRRAVRTHIVAAEVASAGSRSRIEVVEDHRSHHTAVAEMDFDIDCDG